MSDLKNNIQTLEELLKNSDFYCVISGNDSLQLKWKYKSNLMGEILSKRPSFELYINNALYISGITMILFSLRNHFRHPKKENFDYPKYSMKKDWWRGSFLLYCV